MSAAPPVRRQAPKPKVLAPKRRMEVLVQGGKDIPETSIMFSQVRMLRDTRLVSETLFPGLVVQGFGRHDGQSGVQKVHRRYRVTRIFNH